MNLHTKAIVVIFLISSSIADARFYPKQSLEKIFDHDGKMIDEKDKELAHHFSQLPKEAKKDIRQTYELSKINVAKNTRHNYHDSIANCCRYTIAPFGVANFMQFFDLSKIIAILAGVAAGIATGIMIHKIVQKCRAYNKES